MSSTAATARPQTGSPTQAAPHLLTPNLYVLSGPGLHITYSTTSFGGKPQLSYQDTHRMLSFSGDQIRRIETPDLAAIVGVTLALTLDAGSTTFSVLIPRVHLPQQPPMSSAPIRTDGITTVHRLSLVPALNLGQLDIYSVTPLTGTASHVLF